MAREEVLAKVKEIIQDVFDNDEIQIFDDTIISEIDGWDSFMSITLLGTVEDEFNVKFNMKDVVGIKKIGDIVDCILEIYN